MIVFPAAVGTFLLVNLLCACVALGVGFAAGVWFFGAKLAKPAAKAPQKKPAPKQPGDDPKRAVERAAMAASRVADVAQNVASDVGDHAAKMKAISADLAGIDREALGPTGAVVTALDQMLAANAELQERLSKAENQLVAQAAEIRAHESEARTDSLTGLSNRRAFDDELKRRFSEWQRNQTPCTLVLLDIDFFKKFNDTHGHQVGDEVLRQVAKVLKAQSRDMDLPCRYGGEEFGVILPATDAAAACKVAERIRAAVEESSTVAEGKTLKVTCSVGLSQFGANDEIAKLIHRADDGLYASKKAGRNCGHWHNGVTCVPITASIGAPAADAPVEKPAQQPPTAEPTAKRPPRTSHGRMTAPGTFLHILKRRVTESHRFGIPLSVMHLKLENYETASRKHGAEALKPILDLAEPALEKTLREMDVIARLEYGEFVMMLPGNTSPEAGQVAKRLRHAISPCVVPLADGEFQFRFRHGIAELKPKETAQELLARARASAITPTTSEEPVEY